MASPKLHLTAKGSRELSTLRSKSANSKSSGDRLREIILGYISKNGGSVGRSEFRKHLTSLGIEGTPRQRGIVLMMDKQNLIEIKR